MRSKTLSAAARACSCRAMKRTLLGFTVVVFVAAAAACSSASSPSGAASSSSSGMGMGGMGQMLPLGSPCAKDADCGDGDYMCMTDHPDGYCVKMCNIKNVDKDCPIEGTCRYDGMEGHCHMKCDKPADCRAGYDCMPASTDPMDTASHSFCGMAEPMDGGPG